MDEPLWDKGQVRDFVKHVMKAVGKPGWLLIGERLQRALIAEEAMRTVCLQRQDVPAGAARRLLADMLKEAGL